LTSIVSIYGWNIAEWTGQKDKRTKWNSQPLSESVMEFLRALRERGLEGN
jgi:hypothetical protein